MRLPDCRPAGSCSSMSLLFLLVILFTKTIAEIISVSASGSGLLATYHVTFIADNDGSYRRFITDSSPPCDTASADGTQALPTPVTTGNVYTIDISTTNYIGKTICLGLSVGPPQQIPFPPWQEFYIAAPGAPPSKTGGLRITSISKNASNQSLTTLTWNAASASPAVTNYLLRWESTRGVTAGSVGGTTLTRTVTGLTWLTNYTFYVDATNTYGTSTSDPLVAKIVMNNCGSNPCPSGYDCVENGPGYDCCRRGSNPICVLCPSNSLPNATSSSGCMCNVGYGGDGNSSCTAIPPGKTTIASIVLNLDSMKRSVTRVNWIAPTSESPITGYTLSWTMPTEETSTSQTSYDIVGLTWFTTYSFTVTSHAENGLTSVSNSVQKTIDFRNCDPNPCLSNYDCVDRGPHHDCCRSGAPSFCVPCPPFSYPNQTAPFGCTCDVGYGGDGNTTCTPIPPEKVMNVTYDVTKNAANESITTVSWNVPNSESPITGYTLRINGGGDLPALGPPIQVVGLTWLTAYNFTIITTAANNLTSTSDPIEGILEMQNCGTDPCARSYDCIDRGPSYDCCRQGAVSICVPCPLNSHPNSTAPFGCWCDNGYEGDGNSTCTSEITSPPSCPSNAVFNASSPTLCTCLPRYYGDGLTCVQCSVFSDPISQACTCPANFVQVGEKCFSTLSSQDHAVNITLKIDDTTTRSPDFISNFISDLSTSLDIPPSRIQIVSITHPTNPSDPALVTFVILPPTGSTQDRKSSFDVASDLWTQLNDPDSKLNQGETTRKLLKNYINLSFYLILGNELKKLSVITLVLVLGIPLLIIIGVGYYNYTFFPAAKTMRLVTFLLSMLTFSANAFFVYSLYSANASNLEWAKALSTVALVLPLALNFIFSVFHIRREVRVNTNFAKWAEKFRWIYYLGCFLSTFGIRNALLLSSEVLGLESMSAPIAAHREFKFQYLGILGNVFGDIPMIIAQIGTSISIGVFQFSTIISLVFTLVNLVVGLASRGLSYRQYKKAKGMQLEKMRAASMEQEEAAQGPE